MKLPRWHSRGTNARMRLLLTGATDIALARVSRSQAAPGSMPAGMGMAPIHRTPRVTWEDSCPPHPPAAAIALACDGLPSLFVSGLGMPIPEKVERWLDDIEGMA